MAGEMVERVARAIRERTHGKGWSPTDDDFLDARAAIEAMREPTDAILNVGPGNPYMDAEVWGRMIDAALQD